MLTVRTGNRLPRLFEALVSTLQTAPLHPLEQETVIVAQNTGLRSWLEFSFARRLGCAASLDMPSPRGFSAELARRLVPQERIKRPDGLEVPRDPFERESLTWRIAALLPTLPLDDRYRPLHTYLARARHGLLPLSAQIARCLDDYQVYRPALLAAWQRGENPYPDWPHSAWQADLWRRLTADLPGLDRAAELELLIDRLSRLHDKPDGLPARITVFGALLFPPIYLRVLHAVSRFIPVTFYAVIPAPDYGRFPLVPNPGDPTPDNLLLQHLGVRSREFFTVLASLSPTPAIETLAYECPAGNTMLHVLQADLMDDVLRGTVAAPAITLAPEDRSLQVHDCHAPLRELEVLRDQLLDAFETLPGLRPDQVQVIVPDLKVYAPLIDAVFGAEQVSGVTLPYHIVGHPNSPERRVLEAMLKMLTLATTRLTGTDLLELLDYPVLRRRADIREDELDVLRDWIRKTYVYWGKDGLQKAAFDLPEDDRNTWRSGLDQLMLGYAMGDLDALVLDHVPCGEASMERADLLGRFMQWMETLFAYLDDLQSARPLADWATLFLTRLEDLFEAYTDEELAGVQYLRETFAELTHLHHLARHNLEAGSEVAVDFPSIKAHLEDVVGTYTPEEYYVTGRITFVDFLTLRYAPYRVVAIVGLNDGVFPRQEQRVAFDAQAYAPLPGDLAPRVSDKQLFLDALMAAEDRLLLSFVGRSQKDNSERAASVVLDALLDVCSRSFVAEGYEAVRDRIVTRHRLQPFSPAYFTGKDDRFFSYAARHCVRAPEAASRQSIMPFHEGALDIDQAPQYLTVDLDELTGAWVNPSRYFCRQHLGLNLSLRDLTLPDEEPILLDALQLYALKNRLLGYALRGVSAAEARALLRAGGALPPGTLGDAWFQQAWQKAAPMAAYLLEKGTRGQAALLTESDGWSLASTLSHVTGQQNLLFRCAKVKGKDLIGSWLAHLALNAHAEDAGGPLPRTTQLVGEDQGFFFPPIDGARALLDGLVSRLQSMRQAPPPFFDRASQVFVEKGMSAAAKAYRDDFNPCDLNDPYVALCFRGRDPLQEDPDAFQEWAEVLWSPLLSQCQEGYV